jgi:hypothetical protein
MTFILSWKKPYKSENGSLLLRFELPFPTPSPAIAAWEHQVLCKVTDLILSSLLTLTLISLYSREC